MKKILFALLMPVFAFANEDIDVDVVTLFANIDLAQFEQLLIEETRSRANNCDNNNS